MHKKHRFTLTAWDRQTDGQIAASLKIHVRWQAGRNKLAKVAKCNMYICMHMILSTVISA